MAKLDEEQVKQFRTLIREEVRPIIREEVQAAIQTQVRPIVQAEVTTALVPVYEKLDQIRTTQIEDSNALAAAHVELSKTVGDHERRIKKLERARV